MKTLNAVLLPALLLLGGMWFSVSAEDEQPEVKPAPQPGQVSETELGEILATIGLKPTKTEQRYDFAFKTSYRGEEWKFSMSAVLSRNGQSVWVMAWLDQIPTDRQVKFRELPCCVCWPPMIEWAKANSSLTFQTTNVSCCSASLQIAT